MQIHRTIYNVRGKRAQIKTVNENIVTRALTLNYRIDYLFFHFFEG